MNLKKILQDAIFGGMCIALGAYGAAPLDKPWNGIVFSSGLVMIILMQLQLFTGNILRVRGGFTKEVILKYWCLVYFGNFIGCFLSAKILIWSGYELADLINIASVKSSLGFCEAFWRGIFCNVLVCIAVYMAGRIKEISMAKLLVIIIPVALFVISGYEHSVADMFYFSVGNSSFLNLIPVTLGNIIGGLLVIRCTDYQVKSSQSELNKINKINITEQKYEGVKSL